MVATRTHLMRARKEKFLWISSCVALKVTVVTVFTDTQSIMATIILYTRTENNISFVVATISGRVVPLMFSLYRLVLITGNLVSQVSYSDFNQGLY